MPHHAKNSRALYDYDFKKTFDAGLVLTGAEVKSVKQGNVSLQGSYVSLASGITELVNCHIGPYRFSAQENYDPTKNRKILLNHSEILELLGKEKGLTIIPLEIYSTSRGFIKLKLGLGRARKKLDKREYIKKRDTQKELKQHADR